MENKDKLLIAKEALHIFNSYRTMGICASFVMAAEYLKLIDVSTHKAEQEFLETNFSVLKQISINVTNNRSEIILNCQPNFFTEKFWWSPFIKSVRNEVIEIYIKLLEDEINVGV